MNVHRGFVAQLTNLVRMFALVRGLIIRMNATHIFLVIARLLVFVVVMNQICYSTVIATSVAQTDKLSQISEDRSVRSPEEARIHPYGSSYGTINERGREPEAASTDPMNTAAS